MFNKRAGKSEKRKFPSLLVMIPSILFILFLLWVVYFIHDFGKSMYEPKILTGEDARVYVESFFSMKLPQSADKFYYMEEGFQDSFYTVGLSVPPDDAWKFIAQYTGKKKSAFSQYKGSKDITSEDTKRSGILEMKSPLIFSRKYKDTIKSVIYDEETQRLLVYSSSW